MQYLGISYDLKHSGCRRLTIPQENGLSTVISSSSSMSGSWKSSTCLWKTAASLPELRK